ncbi:MULTISPECIES: efflux transporter outer membrane subunit [unclassified Variovorax]|uniref:efflux transporter outer membrane subunit n=1 Tax=unclassified Variovorax TaxID=663243 RepID=UPI00257527D1|nr:MULTISPECIES: efflux transporter outer membrane subunit [unclassified Variovorax]MDM0089455.1 efflux transporter outer membrane subunit [Variovorax sp. J22G40]MDM0147527.1 efflux transporter outer membrane subunit [Variovorax sp. J2P1-31]
MTSRRFLSTLTVLAAAAALSACAVGPRYERPALDAPSAWKEAPAAEGWLPAAPADALERGPWWLLFGDADLNALADRVQVSNQNIAAAVASYAQASALVRQQRAGLLPSVSLTGGASRNGNRDTGTASGSANATLGADWAPDVWGRLGLAVDSAAAQAQASAADLAAARLSAQGALASNYFSLREADAELALLATTLEGYERSLTIARNRYEAGIAAQSDVLQAQTTLVNTRAERVALQRTRDTLEHAIAVLVGVAPADFRIPVAATWTPTVPSVPLGVPSTLLQRRPDIASAERAVAAANAQIGVERAAYYPSFSLSASLGRSSSRVSDLFGASNTLWSLGLSAAQVIFDAGAIDARVDSAKAAHEAAVARYRQTVLTAFQGVEDQLTATASLAQQEALRREASAAADLTEQQILNRYRAGQVSYTEVVTAQASALSARRTVLQLQVNRQNAAVTLIQGLGGGWTAPD